MLQALIKATLLVPPAALLVCGLALLAAVPGAWGAANHAQLQPWVPPLGGLMFAVMAIVLGAVTVRAVWRRFGEEVFVIPFQIAFSVFMMLATALMAAAIAVRIGDPSSYDSFLDANGRPNTSAAGFLAITAGVLLFLFTFLVACAFTYVNAITDRGPKRFERHFDEPDRVAAMLRGRRSAKRRSTRTNGA